MKCKCGVEVDKGFKSCSEPKCTPTCLIIECISDKSKHNSLFCNHHANKWNKDPSCDLISWAKQYE